MGWKTEAALGNEGEEMGPPNADGVAPLTKQLLGNAAPGDDGTPAKKQQQQ